MTSKEGNLKQHTALSKESLDTFLKMWNIKFPYDKLWRDKYNIPFRSKAHLEMSQINIYLDIREDILIKKLQAERLEFLKNKKEYSSNNSLFKEQVLTKEEEDKIYNNLKFPGENG